MDLLSAIVIGYAIGSLPMTLHTTSAIEDAVTDAAFVVMAVPSHGMRAVARAAAPFTAAGESSVAVAMIQAHFRSPTLRLYGTSDVVGVEIGGALKNIIAIAAFMGRKQKLEHA